MLNGVDQSNRESCLSLFNGWRTLQTFLTQLYLQIEPTGGNIPTYAPGELPTGLPLTDNIFGRAYRFNSLDEARLHTLLFTLESFFYQMFPRCIRLTKAHHPDILPNSINLTDWEIYGPQMAEYYAYESARCLPYCATRGMGSEGTYYAPHCLFNVFRICSLTRNLEALVWCDKSFEFIERSGNDAAGRLREYLWSQWCGADKDIALAKGGVYRKVGDRLGHMNP